MITPIEYLFLALLTLGTGLGSAWIVYRVIKPGLKRAIAGYFPLIGKTIRSEMGKTIEKATEGLDLGAISGAISGEEGGLGNIAGMLGGSGGGLGELLKLFSQMSGKGKEGGGSSGW